MSTNKSHPVPPITSLVAQVDELASRRQLQRLLDLRYRLAALSAERSSHRLDDAGETYGLLLTVETQIQHEFPDVYEERFADWVSQEVSMEHPAGVLQPNCGICRTIATSSGINLHRPQAA